MEDINLNLARKWRTQNFDQIVGQDLPVRMLKNSLYLNQFFPVYLFSGQHGCGKTSTARIFAAAVNCQQLPLFQKDPKQHNVPCLSCASCVAMRAGKHVDFIEIDAASHTGVDNIRTIIDAASLMPLSGRKKIYLIDEAHMLSKAAFNALLKILEEPPHAALFILATTEAQKIIDTVRSRCFQLFFKAVDTSTLVEYLQTICSAESIEYEVSGLELIVNQTHGSVRDALNIIEQFRFLGSTITKQQVAQVLGHIDTPSLIEILRCMFGGHAKELLLCVQERKIEHYNAEFMWYRIIEILRALLWHKYGVPVDETAEYAQYVDELASHCSIARIQAALALLYANEAVFLKTTKQHIFLQMLLLQLCAHKKNNNDGGSFVGAPVQPAALDDELLEHAEQESACDSVPLVSSVETGLTGKWKQFLNAIKSNDPLIDSIFSQCVCVAFHESTGILDIEIPKNLSFFESMVHEQRHVWLPHMQTVFVSSSAAPIALNFIFVPAREGGASQAPLKKSAVVSRSMGSHTAQKVETVQTASIVHKKSEVVMHGAQQVPQETYRVATARSSVLSDQFSKKIDISDVDRWKMTHMILQHFPGSVWQLGD